MLGAALIILFAKEGTFAYQLLSSRAFVGVGLISYSVYLWHQPLFAFARYASIDEPSPSAMTALAGLALLLGFFSWKYVENPLRDRRRFARRQVFLFSGSVSVLFIALGVAGAVTGGLPQRYPMPAKIAGSLVNTLQDECHESFDGKGLSIHFCAVGDRSQSPSIALFGDSHARCHPARVGFDGREARAGVSPRCGPESVRHCWAWM